MYIVISAIELCVPQTTYFRKNNMEPCKYFVCLLWLKPKEGQIVHTHKRFLQTVYYYQL